MLMLGSTSDLSRVGTSFYASDWTDLVAQMSGTWRRVRVRPFIPLIASECPGILTCVITGLGMWLSTEYNNNPLDLQDA